MDVKSEIVILELAPHDYHSNSFMNLTVTLLDFEQPIEESILKNQKNYDSTRN